MALGKLDRRKPDSGLLQIGDQPTLVQKVAHAGNLLRLGGPQIQMRRNAGVDGSSCLVDGGELEPLRYHVRLAGAGNTTVLDGVLQEEDRRQRVAGIGVIH